MDEKLIIIGGGVGPMAGVELHKKIIENTSTNGKDQDHLQVWHLSRSYDVPDRTGYLNGKTKTNPAEGMARTFLLANEALKKENRLAVGGVTCNTFHAPKIFNKFIDILNKVGPGIKILNMIEQTGNYLKENFSGTKKIGLLSTTGTRNTKIYQQTLLPLGFEIIQIPENEQAALHDTIYNLEWGIKAISPVSEKAKNRFMRYAKQLAQKGAGAIILGCTEIPLALPEKEINGIPLVDPVYILAREMIKNANHEKLSIL